MMRLLVVGGGQSLGGGWGPSGVEASGIIVDVG